MRAEPYDFIAFVQILLFAELSQRLQGTLGGLVTRFRAYVPKKLFKFFLLNPFFDACWHTNLPRLYDVQLFHLELITMEWKVQVVVSLGSQ